MYVFSLSKKGHSIIDQAHAEEERRLATSQTFLGRIKVDSNHLYLDEEEQRKIRNELLELIRK